MQEKQVSGQQGTYCKENTDASRPVCSARRSAREQHSQAASNHSNPVMQPRSDGLHSGSFPNQPTLPNSEMDIQQQGSRHSQCSRMQEEGAKPKEADQDDTIAVDTAVDGDSVTTPETILFDLTAEPGVDTDMPPPFDCDLSLKLTLPMFGEKAQMKKVVMPSGSHSWRPVASVSAPTKPLQPSYSNLRMVGSQREMVLGGHQSRLTGNDLSRGSDGTRMAAIDPRLTKRRGDLVQERGASKKRKTQSGPTSIGQGGMINFMVDQPESSIHPAKKKVGVRGRKQTDKTKGSAGCPQTATRSQ